MEETDYSIWTKWEKKFSEEVWCKTWWHRLFGSRPKRECTPDLSLCVKRWRCNYCTGKLNRVEVI